MKNKTILILDLDNEEDLLEKICGMLEGNLKVIKTKIRGSVADLLDKIKPDLVVLEIKINWREGIEVLREIRRCSKKIAVIVTTGFGSIEVSEACANLSTQGYFRKPFSHYDMLNKMKEVLFNGTDELSELHSNSKTTAVKIGLKFIKGNYTNPISPKDVAKYVCLSRSHLGTIFKRDTGFTVSKYINHYKIEESKKLIEEHLDLKFSAISEMSGFRNEFYFQRVFKKLTNSTPGQFRRLLKKP